MKKKISLRLFLTVIWRGICQIFQFIGRLFGYKDESTYAKIIWRIFASCITLLLALFTVAICYGFSTKVVYQKWIKSFTSSEVNEYQNLSKYIVFQSLYNSPVGRIYDKTNKKIILKDVDWVVTSSNGDSLAVFSQYGKRGYINRYNGKISIPLSFTKAWVFSEGLAAVEKDNELVFIDHSGKIIIDQDFQVDEYSSMNYSFQYGYCIIKDPVTKKLGLIDKSGKWALAPDYENIFNDHGFWQVEKNNLIGLYKPNLEIMFSTTNSAIYIDEDAIEVRMTNHIAKRYNYNGEVMVDFVIDGIENLIYETEKLSKDRTDVDEISDLKVYDVATCLAYMVYDGNNGTFYGLLDRDGKQITQPLYTNIKAIGKDLYLCHPNGILINSKGEEVK